MMKIIRKRKDVHGGEAEDKHEPAVAAALEGPERLQRIEHAEIRVVEVGQDPELAAETPEEDVRQETDDQHEREETCRTPSSST